ncbi:hypothetical protein AQPE_2909 [Aquipluma nitroreducens]|uniref:Uncharacterized protein n=1 Tax=Aquipluma nitroreducens TaxID=2010828 RepID=A0A5K7SBQ7_9BACT|nr:hypothetical protein [Aquipluma nitroreducens]BBE18744.1 hypothetical protein AQPE_2909 [Aquipluma nitroreducens]
MKLLKCFLLILTSFVFVFLILSLGMFLYKFSDGLSSDPEQWYSAGSVFIALLSLLATSLIATFVYEVTKQTAKYQDQQKIRREIQYLTGNFWKYHNTDLLYSEYVINTELLVFQLNILLNESFIFNNPELFEKGFKKYSNKLDSIIEYMGSKFLSHRFDHDDPRRLGNIRLQELDENIFDHVEIKEEEIFLNQSIINAMK